MVVMVEATGALVVKESAQQHGAPKVLSAEEWAVQNFAQVDLGLQRLTQRVVEIAAKMAAHPEESLPRQMEDRSALVAGYRVLNNDKVTMAALHSPHYAQTLEAARRSPVVLMVQDTTELDYTAHPSTKALGPIGDGRGRGLLLHSTLAVVPEGRQLLGLAHAQAVLRELAPKPRPRWACSAEGRLWEEAARGVGSPPEGVTWVHVADRGGEDFGFMVACSDLGKGFLVRAFHNRVLKWEEDDPRAKQKEARHLLDYARSLPPSAETEASYTVSVPPGDRQPAREARVVMAWAGATIPAPTQGPRELRRHAPIKVWILRVWEPDPPEGAEALEWILLCSLPITSVEEALRTVDWYSCRWLVEDYHMCLKTGCKVEETQLDDGEDIRRLLGFEALIAVRLLQLRQCARQAPELPAKAVVEPLMVDVLARRLRKDGQALTIGQFWQSVARLGGHQGRRSDGPPGWRTLWKGWRFLSDMTEGVRLFTSATTSTGCV